MTTGQRVTLTEDGRQRDGLVFDMPSASKVVVAVMDRRRGPVLRTVHPRTLSDRAEDGADDAVLRRLLRRTPTPVRGGASGGAGTGHGRAAFTRAATHRPTGR